MNNGEEKRGSIEMSKPYALLSNKLKEEVGEELHRRKLAIRDGLLDAKNGFLAAGKQLMVIKQKKLYRLEGNHIISFAHWVENELGISKATAYQMIEVYEKFGDILGEPEYDQIEYSKAAALTCMVKPGATVQEREELLMMAKDQSVRGLKDNIREKKGLTTSDECQHPADQQEVWNKCRACSKWWR